MQLSEIVKFILPFTGFGAVFLVSLTNFFGGWGKSAGNRANSMGYRGGVAPRPRGGASLRRAQDFSISSTHTSHPALEAGHH